MWGNLVTETAFVQNFTFGFPTKQSDILLHLTHWQYWFWFWFTYYMVLYYFIFLRLIRYRVLKMSPKLATSFRSHGKWGDLLVCFIPISWCTNILSNSNFILRMIEWQSESSLFTLRVRGKQWYWVYKFELKSLNDLASTSKSVGTNYWLTNNSSNHHHHLGLIQSKHVLSDSHLKWSSSGAKQLASNTEGFNDVLIGRSSTNSLPLKNVKLNALGSELNQPTNGYSLAHNYAWRSSQNSGLTGSYDHESIALNQQSSASVTTHPNITRVDKVATTTVQPSRLGTASNMEELVVSFPNQPVFTQKPSSNNFYLVVKQKRYSPSSMSSNKYTLDSGSFSPTKFSAKNNHFIMQHSAVRSELPTLQSNRRLLRTRRVLVLPAHTNITLITNSFDVMHSWHIPGLGVKLDCVPGRSTHHTIHIDHAGFYYGQCAEICGRYHHHMPIRVCALPFEHFLIWWYHYGAPFFLAGNQDRTSFISQTNKTINW
jgi:heme/copper-type cytochrome/quinol oxidase subunit 2